MDLVPRNVSGDSEPVVVDEYKAHPEYFMEKVETKLSHKYYSCCPDYYPTLKFTVHLRRYPLFYMAIVVIPIAMLTLCSFLSFSLNPDSGERIRCRGRAGAVAAEEGGE